MLDSDLATLYGVPTYRLNEAVKRNIKRFPPHYMFQLSNEEWESLISQIAISKNGRGGRRFAPYAFTEQGVAMLATVLNSEKAIQINIQIIDTFVSMRKWAVENKDLSRRLTELEHYFIEHCQDQENDMRKLYEAIGLLMDRTKPSKIGF
ncbi:ORF6N domain-containing protein [bacterium]|nr:ORF6N domain-containing protein [bacterium]